MKRTIILAIILWPIKVLEEFIHSKYYTTTMASIILALLSSMNFIMGEFAVGIMVAIGGSVIKGVAFAWKINDDAKKAAFIQGLSIIGSVLLSVLVTKRYDAVPILYTLSPIVFMITNDIAKKVYFEKPETN